MADKILFNLLLFWVFKKYNPRRLKPVYSFFDKNDNNMNKLQSSLAFCLLMDFLGYATYALPFLGEFADVIWAPISAFIFYKTFGGWKGAFGGLFNFAEEILPFTDFIPTFTITWVWQYFAQRKNSAVVAKNVVTIKS